MAQIDLNEPCPCGSGKLYSACHLPMARAPEPLPITERMTLTVMPEPDPGTRAVFVYEGEGTTVFTGFDTGLALDCGECGACLVRGLIRDAVLGLVLRCKNCGSYNDTQVGGAG